MQKFLALLFLVCCSVGLSVLVMIYGWGLHPRSWWWIIGAGVFGVTVINTAYSKMLDSEEKQRKSNGKP